MQVPLESFEDIKLLVDSFYEKVRQNTLLAPLFEEKIQDRWGEHLIKMYAFWETLLLENHTYFGSPFAPHADLKVEKIHFDTWLKLFKETVDEHFIGDKAEDAKIRAERMAEMFFSKIEYYRKTSNKPLF